MALMWRQAASFEAVLCDVRRHIHAAQGSDMVASVRGFVLADRDATTTSGLRLNIAFEARRSAAPLVWLTLRSTARPLRSYNSASPRDRPPCD
jgi:hypothetical protein